MSSMASSGKSSRQGRPVAGLMLAGPVEPMQEPSELMHSTKYLSVSMCFPGPTMSSHQPGERSFSLDAACALGDRPVKIRTALRSEEHTSELQSRGHLVCRLLLEKKKKKITDYRQK